MMLETFRVLEKPATFVAPLPISQTTRMMSVVALLAPDHSTARMISLVVVRFHTVGTEVVCVVQNARTQNTVIMTVVQKYS